MEEVQLFQGYRATTSRQFTFYHIVPRSPGTHLIDLGRMKDWVALRTTNPLVLNLGPLVWVSSSLTFRPLLRLMNSMTFFRLDIVWKLECITKFNVLVFYQFGNISPFRIFSIPLFLWLLLPIFLAALLILLTFSYSPM